MKLFSNDDNLKTEENQNLLAENTSAYNLCAINGCSDTLSTNDEQVYIGFYH